MESINLEVKIRAKEEKKAHYEKMIPAILYGRDMENVMLWVNQKAFNKTLKEAGESTIIDLVVQGQKEPHKVLVYDLQRDPVSGKFNHVDFFRVKMDEEITTEVELEFVGEAPAVKEQGGVLIKNIDAVSVRCLPADLPGSITVDISSLETFEDHICIKDLPISDKVKIDIDKDTVVALVSPPRSEQELEDLEGEVDADISKVEGMSDETADDEEEKEEEEKEKEKGEKTIEKEA